MQPGVVALRLDVGDVAAVDEPGHPAALDGDLGVVAGRRGLGRAVDGADHPAYGLGEPVGAHRLEHVVDRVQVEGLDGVLLVGGDEDDRRRGPEAAEHLGQLEPGQAGHLDVEEDRVDRALLQDPQRRRSPRRW